MSLEHKHHSLILKKAGSVVYQVSNSTATVAVGCSVPGSWGLTCELDFVISKAHQRDEQKEGLNTARGCACSKKKKVGPKNKVHQRCYKDVAQDKIASFYHNRLTNTMLGINHSIMRNK